MIGQVEAQNLLAFLERVAVTGTREAAEYLRCCQILIGIANPAQVPTPNPGPAAVADNE